MATREKPKTLQRALRIAFQNHAVAIIIALSLILFIPCWLKWIILYIGGILYVMSILLPFVDDWRPKPKVPTEGKAVLITGCDSGFGHYLVQRLDDLGLEVFAGCLFPDKEGAQTLRKSCSSRLHILGLDVTSEESVCEAAKYVTDNIGEKKLWSIVNNAGINFGGEINWTSFEKIYKVLDVNTLGVVRVTKAFLPKLCKNKGRVVTVASAAGRSVFAGMVPYCMSKHATISFMDGLRLESYRFGVKCITVEPWMYKTSIIDKNTIFNYLNNAWDETPKDIKELYPENYLETFKRITVKLLNLSTSDNPQEVVECLVEAVLAIDPKYSYNPGTVLSRLFYWFLSRLPRQFADAVMLGGVH